MGRRRTRAAGGTAGVLAALALVLAAGCARVGSAAPVATTRVEMPPSYRFEPAVITVRAGSTVTWHNADNFTHSVAVLGGGFPFLNLRPGQSARLTFSRPGVYDYVCTYHAQDMKGRVIVTGP
ncbi:MAG: cupredoxin domain-containing protein [Armatimonadota bacterium]|nr:cupredoxin domain-containing protein [Armatimonadota bacterium]MDR7403942.1 cupredoxin domain-containing protein [Armatimonadota bacterium]